MTEITFTDRHGPVSLKRRLLRHGHRATIHRLGKNDYVVWTEATPSEVKRISAVAVILRDEQVRVRSVDGLGARKSMTFGQMPSFAEFEKAFDIETEEYGHCYPMDLRGIDMVTTEPIHEAVWRPAARAGVAPKTYRGQTCFGAKVIYGTVKALAAIWDSNIDAPTSQWSEKEGREYQKILDAWESADPDNRYSVEELRENAGSLASSIMETLGFEWI